jgi:hypothetical protein
MSEQPTPPVVAATWRAENFAALEVYLDPLYVDIFEGKQPPILVDARGYEMVAYQGTTGNPLMAVALEAFYGNGQRSLAEGVPRQQRDLAGAADEARMLLDTIIAAVVVAPPYAPRSRCGADGRQPPPGHLWWGSFTSEQRRILGDFFYAGAEALKSVRRVAGPDEPTDGDGERLRGAAVEPADPAGAGVPPLVAGRGDGLPGERPAGDAGPAYGALDLGGAGPPRTV